MTVSKIQHCYMYNASYTSQSFLIIRYFDIQNRFCFLCRYFTTEI